MANKRQLKKRVYSICGDLASDALIAGMLFKEVNKEKINKIINDIADLQESTLAKATFSFDKAPRDFDNRAEYNKAHRKYFTEAYNRLNKEFIDRASKIVDELNEAVPADARKIVSSL